MNEKILALIVAGGRGTRLKGDPIQFDGFKSAPKQYMQLSNNTIIEQAINAFTNHQNIDNVMVVIHRDDNAIYSNLVGDHPKLLAPVIGGKTRRQSVHCGLIAAQNMGFGGKILIHDAARPFVEQHIISQIIENVSLGIGAIAGHQISDTLKKCSDNLQVKDTIARDDLFSAQTPQGFMASEIIEVHERAAKNELPQNNGVQFTDDASMFEAAGKLVKIIPSPSTNFKITTADDLAHARSLANSIDVQPPISGSSKPLDLIGYMKKNILHMDIRTGNGYDVHAFEPGDGVILCGYKIPFDKKLKGHSDADAALHSLTDAILGTIGAGDIGTHFPPSNPQWKNASSDHFLKAALAMVKEKGGKINNVDLTIICEEPKIGPHRQFMRRQLAKLCALEPERVSLKATTNEKMGFLGRAEGIAVIATTSISFGSRK